jgi:PAS domain S-box-containing protein
VTKETRFQELKRYVSFTEDDARRLAAFGAVAKGEFPRIAREFYERIREHEDAHAVLRDEDQIKRLHESLVRWLGRLCSGPYDEAYFEERSKIGRVHVKVGLPQRYMLTAMALVRVSLSRLADELMGSDGRSTSEALDRLLGIELAIMLESYQEDQLARARRIERLESHEVGRTVARARHRYVNAVELAHILVVGLDARREVRLFNKEAERVSGYARDEVFGKPFAATLIQEDLSATVDAALERLLTHPSAENATLEVAVHTRAGKYRDIRWQLAHAPSEEGDDVVLFALGKDVTEENARADRQRQQQKLAAVGTLAAGLAHEIRNPLNGAQLHISFLERSLKGAKARTEDLDAVRVVGDEIKRLATLVTEFLDFARPQPPVRKEVSIRNVCERATQLVGARAEAAHVAIESDLPSRDIVLLADPAKLEQVMLNLLANAIEALEPGGGGRVVVRVRRQPRRVVLEVEDDGPGLPSPDAPIFDPFFSTKPDGTGLGLAITHRIITDHEGDIGVETRPGRTVFRMGLPIDSERG